MAIIVNFFGASLKKPGAYSRVRVAEGGVAEAQLGVMAIVGESDEGDALAAEANFSDIVYTPDQFNAIRAKFGSGPLVDAARLALVPSNDVQIVGGAQQLIVAKTNQSVKASLALPPVGFAAKFLALLAKLDADAGISDTNYAALYTPGNQSLAIYISSFNGILSKLDADAGVSDVDYVSTLTAGPALAYPAFIVKFDALLAKLDADAGVSDINYASLLTPSVVDPYGIVYAAKAGTPGNSLSVEMTTVSLQKIITIRNGLSGESEVSDAIGGQAALTIQLVDGAASAGTMTINATHLTTSVTGGSSANLNIKLSDFATIGQLANYIENQSGYTAVATVSQQNLSPSILDRVLAANIKTAPYIVLRDSYDIRSFFNSSAMVTFVPTADAGYRGLPDDLAQTFLYGGLRGATSNANIQAAFDALGKQRINFVVPLFSRSASGGDIAEDITDPGSTYTIDSIHSIARTHCVQNSTIRGRKERQAFCAYKGTFDDSKDKAANLGAARVSLLFQNVDYTDANGNSIVDGQPHYLAAIAAGMKCAAVVGLPNTFKLINANGFSHPSFDPELDVDAAIDANLTFVEKAPGGGIRFVLDNSTYGQTKDAWIYNRPSVLYAADVASYAIRLNTEQFVGQRNSDVTDETIKNLLISVMDGLRASGIIVADVNTKGKGFKDLSVKINGSVVNISVTLALVEGLEFILADIQVQRAQF